MSHFTVTVKLSAKRMNDHGGDVNSALTEILAPYDECTKDDKYIEFVDITDEYLAKYNDELIEQVKLDDGTYVWTWDEQFRVPGTFGTGTTTHKHPQEKVVHRKAEEVYGSFENYMKEYYGCEKNGDGRYGYRRNPNAKWDWWVIGGRWMGHFPLKAASNRVLGKPGALGNSPNDGCGDIVSIDDIDFDAIAAQARDRAGNFYAKYQQLLAGEEFSPFDGPRFKAMKMGLIHVEKKAVEAGAGEVAFSWRERVGSDDDRADWTDVCKVINEDDLIKEYIDCFNPILTYAFLDDEGWSSPGEIGWFGCSSDTPNDYLSFAKEFARRVFKSANRGDVFVCVDCHI
jgi:hypothetical protein